MNSFLYEVTRQLYEKYTSKLSDCWIVFPNRRAGLFFTKYLNEIITPPFWSPKVITINELIHDLSKYHIEDNLGLLFRLYKIYIKHRDVEESFDDFYFWGEMLMSDFDDIDKYRVDAKHLFKNLASEKEIDMLFDYLNEDQIKAIQTFWKSFNPDKISTHQNEFVAVWETLYSIYRELKEELKNEGLAYEGMAYRDLLSRMDAGEVTFDAHKIVFVGFNALNKCEIDFFKYLKDKNLAEFYWDYDQSYVDNVFHEAGLFMRDNLRMFPSPIKDVNFSNFNSQRKEFDFIALSSDVGQAKYSSKIIKEYFDQEDNKPEETAIILADEELLLPVLHSIPECVKNINVTMGYPAKNTPVASLLGLLISLHKSCKSKPEGYFFQHKDVLALLNHQYLNTLDPVGCARSVNSIIASNKIYVTQKDIKAIDVISSVFLPVKNVAQLSSYLLDLLQKVYKQIEQSQSESQMVDKIEKEYIYSLFLAIKRLNVLLRQHAVKMHLDTYYRLVTKMIQSLSVPFEGEPLAGLQIMGILETRLLDFKKIVVLSMNEGKLPKVGAANSFIPFNLRKGFGLPTIDNQDAIFAYYFYRLLQRANDVKLVYSTKSDGMRTGEMSRFLYQIKYESPIPIRELNPIQEISFPIIDEIYVHKNKRILSQLDNYTLNGKRSFSPSALNTYMDCSLKFYYRYLAGLNPIEELKDEVDPLLFGNLFHHTMEFLYKPYEDKLISVSVLDKLILDDKNLNNIIEGAFKKEYFNLSEKENIEILGRNSLIFDILKKYVLRLLNIDKQFAPFLVLKLEGEYKLEVPIFDNRQKVKIKGVIDRIDMIDDTVRVIDYKTGVINRKFSTIESLFDRESKTRNKAIFQTFLYCLFLEFEKPLVEKVSPNIYGLKDVFSKKFESILEQKEGRGKAIPLEDYREYKHEFNAHLQALLEEIFDKDIPFTQVEDVKKCELCPYVEICHR